MKGGNVKEFIDKTTYEECAVLYKGIKYFFTVLFSIKIKMFTLIKSTFGITKETMSLQFLIKTLRLSKNVQKLHKMKKSLMVKVFGKLKVKWNGSSGSIITELISLIFIKAQRRGFSSPLFCISLAFVMHFFFLAKVFHCRTMKYFYGREVDNGFDQKQA